VLADQGYGTRRGDRAVFRPIGTTPFGKPERKAGTGERKKKRPF
jgi:hypothetical protein